MTLDLMAAWMGSSAAAEADSKAAGNGHAQPVSRKRKAVDYLQGGKPVQKDITVDTRGVWATYAMASEDFTGLISRIGALNLDPAQKQAEIDRIRAIQAAARKESDAKRISEGNEKLFKSFQNYPPKQRNDIGLRILKSAIEYEQKDLIESLIKFGVSLAKNNRLTYRCLLAAATSTPEIALAVLSTNPCQEFEGDELDTENLHYRFYQLAIESNNSLLCKTLLDKGWNVCARLSYENDEDDEEDCSEPVCFLALSALPATGTLILDNDCIAEHASELFANAFLRGKYSAAKWIFHRFSKCNFSACPAVHRAFAKTIDRKDSNGLQFLQQCRILSPEILMEAVLADCKPIAKALMKEGISPTDALWCYVYSRMRLPLTTSDTIAIKRFVSLGAKIDSLNELGQSMLAYSMQKHMRDTFSDKWRRKMLMSIGWFVMFLKANPTLKQKNALSAVDLLVRLVNNENVVKNVLQPVFDNIRGQGRQAILDSAYVQAFRSSAIACRYLESIGAHPQQALVAYARNGKCREGEVKSLVAKGADASAAMLPALFEENIDNFNLLCRIVGNALCVDENGFGVLTYLSLKYIMDKEAQFVSPDAIVRKLFPDFRPHPKDVLGAYLLLFGAGIDFNDLTGIRELLPQITYQQLVECENDLQALAKRFVGNYYANPELDVEESETEVIDGVFDGIEDGYFVLCDTYEDQWFEIAQKQAESDSKEQGDGLSGDDIECRSGFMKMMGPETYKNANALITGFLQKWNVSADKIKIFIDVYCERLMGDWRKDHFDALSNAIAEPIIREFSRLQRHYDHIMHGTPAKDREKALVERIVKPIWESLVSALDNAQIEEPKIEEFKKILTTLFVSSDRLDLITIGKHCQNMIANFVSRERKTHFIKSCLLQDGLINRHWFRAFLIDLGVIVPKKPTASAPKEKMDTSD